MFLQRIRSALEEEEPRIFFSIDLTVRDQLQCERAVGAETAASGSGQEIRALELMRALNIKSSL